MKRKTWTKVVLGGAVVGIILAFVTQRVFRTPGKDEPDPNLEKVKVLQREFDAHGSARPSPESVKTMQDLAAQGGDLQANVVTLLMAWLRRMHDEKIADDSPEYHELAAFLLSADPAAPEEAVKSLRTGPKLADKAFEVQLLTTFGKSAVPIVLAAFEEDVRNAQGNFYQESRSYFPEVMAAFGIDALPKLRAEIKHKDPAIRRQALRALAVLARKAPERSVEAVPDVENALNDPDRTVRVFAALAWGDMGGKSPRVVALRLEDPDPHVRLAAARSLANNSSGVDLNRVAAVVESLLRGDAFKDTWWDVVGWGQQDLEELAPWKSGANTPQSAIKYSPLFWEETAAHVNLNLGSPRYRMPPDTVAELLSRCPHDGRHLITLLAANGLADHKDEGPSKTAMDRLRSMLKDPRNPQQRRKALLALGRLGKQVAADSLPDVMAALDDPYVPNRWQAFLALMRLDPDAVKGKLPRLVEQAGVVEQASATLKLTDPTKVSKWTGNIWLDCPAILTPVMNAEPTLDAKGVLHTPIDRDIEAENSRTDGVLLALSKAGRMGKEAVPFLLMVLQGTDRSAAIFARHGEKALGLLAREGSAAASAVPYLINCWPLYDVPYTRKPDEPYDAKRDLIHLALLKIGDSSVPALAKALEDLRRQDSHLKIMGVLQEFGAKAKPAVPALVKTLSGQDEKVASEAAETFGKLGGAAKDAVPDLGKLLNHDEPRVRRHAATALGQIGPAAAAAAPNLIELFAGDSQEQRVVAKRALKLIGKDTVPALMKGLRDPREKVCLGSIETLELMPPDDVQPALAELQKLTAPPQPEAVRIAAKGLVEKLQSKG